MRLKIGKKLRRVSHNPKFSGSYKKESENNMHIILLSIVDNSDNNLVVHDFSTINELVQVRKRTNMERAQTLRFIIHSD